MGELDSIHLGSLDLAATALEALAHVAEQVKAASTPSQGTGTLPCPQCKARGREGIVRFNYEKRKRGSRRISYVAWCETDPQCIRFSGH